MIVSGATFRVAEELKIDSVPSWFPVGFCLLTHGDQQYVAYYNAQHDLIVARRSLSERHWQKAVLPTKIGWDSHNYVTMAVDSAGDLHLSGNMHCVPLIYFRTRVPGDITSFERLPMTGQEEERCTYPRFLRDADGQLLFMYRSGSSGKGRRFVNAYDPQSKTWTRFLDTALFEGEGLRNAYPQGPMQGPDGMFHLVWVWRETPDCATNHHLCYARSRDLKHWQNAAGQSVALPFMLQCSEVWVDPIPEGGGIINGCESLAFDAKNRPTIAYHKRDDAGNMQIYVTRFEDGAWRRHSLTNWDQPIPFGGGGAMPFIGIGISNLTPLEPDLFYLNYRHRDYGSGRIVLDQTSLKPVDRAVTIPTEYPHEIGRTTIDFPGIHAKSAADLGGSADADTRYVLCWETLEANHDRPRQPPLPPASALRLVELQRVVE
ncbi:MAG: BNR repeat-containing protein [Planctomycetes bacterium]|nr:BNR repeat-containing protein [Planctomycetota bacterium]